MNISAQGRVPIPARIRRELGLGPGTPLVTYVEDDRIVLETREHLIRCIQAAATADRPAGECVADELMAERRLEAQGEQHCMES